MVETLHLAPYNDDSYHGNQMGIHYQHFYFWPKKPKNIDDRAMLFLVVIFHLVMVGDSCHDNQIGSHYQHLNLWLRKQNYQW